MESEDIISKLRRVSQAGLPIRLVVAREVQSPEAGLPPQINDVSVEGVGGCHVISHDAQ